MTGVLVVDLESLVVAGGKVVNAAWTVSGGQREADRGLRMRKRLL